MDLTSANKAFHWDFCGLGSFAQLLQFARGFFLQRFLNAL
jgi:hypothetical protein